MVYLCVYSCVVWNVFHIPHMDSAFHLSTTDYENDRFEHSFMFDHLSFDDQLAIVSLLSISTIDCCLLQIYLICCLVIQLQSFRGAFSFVQLAAFNNK
jgi:hypothetical protein